MYLTSTFGKKTNKPFQTPLALGATRKTPGMRKRIMLALPNRGMVYRKVTMTPTFPDVRCTLRIDLKLCIFPIQ